MLNDVFTIENEENFIVKALEIFRFQAQHNPVYKSFIQHLNINVDAVDSLEKIPFLPVEFFKSHKVVSKPEPYDMVFMSSGTTGMQRSKHYVKSLSLYERSFVTGFKHFYGDIRQYVIVALLPSYVAQGHSSLVYMADKLIQLSENPESGFYLNNKELPELLTKLQDQSKTTLLLGVSYALLDLAGAHPMQLSNAIVMETGGMKGRRKEMLREELHNHLTKGFGVQHIHSEYGMTELLSQSYSKGNGIFETPPWQKILIRDTEDPLSYLPDGKTGGINVIDLANQYACSFIATQDLGKMVGKNRFEILGRFDHSDVRGCNLLIV